MKECQTTVGRGLLLAAAIFTGTTAYTQSTSSNSFTVVSRGADYKVMQETTVEHGTNRTVRYTELATGMNYTNSAGQWVESKEQISILPTGGAAATQGRHKVYFPSDIYNGVLEVVTPDGRHLKSRPVGVSFDDGSNSVWIAKLKSAPGYLISSNQVLYPDAFTGVKADLLCTYRRGGFESDLIFRQNPPSPDAYGLDTSASTLQLFTEFFNTDDPLQISSADDPNYGITDDTLKFGKMTMTRGKAFAVDASTNSYLLSPNSSATVYKSWFREGTRKFLVEQLPLEYLADDLQTLPQSTNILTAQISKDPVLYVAQAKRQFPPLREITKDTNQMLMASVDLDKQPGVVLDYNALDGGMTDYTLEADTTYYISGFAEVDGTLTIQGGAVLKYARGADLYVNGVDCQTSPDHPAFFTAKDDDSIGQKISGSTGNPTGYYANSALDLMGAWYVNGQFFGAGELPHLSYLRIYYAAVAISNPEADIGLNLRHSQIVKCDIGICSYGIAGVYLPNFTARNVLFDQIGTAAFYGEVFSGAAENCTFSGVNANYSSLAYAEVTEEFSSYGLGLINCLGANNVYWGFTLGNFEGQVPSVGTCCRSNLASSAFQSAGAASYYLTASSPYRNVGLASVYDATMLADLHAMTTYAPQDGGAPDTGTPDLGYHYPVNEDSNNNGIPDSWEWKYFGNFTQTATGDYDGDGVSNLQEYLNGTDPNTIQFTVDVPNNYVNTSATTVPVAVTKGVPGYYAVMVDSTNLTDATWYPYTSSNLTAHLGTLEGWHNLWIGLSGWPDDSEQTWQLKRLKLDRTPPLLVITNPVSLLVAQPMIQLQGYCPESLSRLTCDLTNAAGVFSNQMILVLDRKYDTNTLEFATSTWQAFDLPLTNGLNQITLRATDQAGNTTNKLVNFTLDYSSKTNPPQVQLTWPTNKTEISGDSFTWRGKVDDFTAVVIATLVATNGSTNVFNAMVERDGKFWAENIPLPGGTNLLTLTVTAAGGLTTTTNITVVKSSMVLRMNPVDPTQLWLPTVSVTGIISDPNSAVWVNGVKGTNNGNGTWAANNVPVTKGGTASFLMTSYLPNEQQPDGSYGN